jgi:transcriptional regulator with XRE-family HTH domain
MASTSSQPRVGPLLGEWRKRRRLTQLDLALDAGISARHLSFVETGRSTPSAEMVLLLAEQLDVPFRERNHMLLAAGHAPAFPERSLQDPELAPVREALDLILTGHEPYPALVVDRGWNLVAANSAIAALADWIDPELLEPPVNLMRVGLHPRGMARWTLNVGEVRAYFVGRLQRQVAIGGDADLVTLLEEVESYPAPAYEHDHAADTAAGEILTPLMRLRAPDGRELSLFATVATFGRAEHRAAERAGHVLGCAGLASFALIMVAAFVAPPLWNAPGTNASAAHVASYLLVDREGTTASLYIYSLAMGLFLCFTGGLLSWLRQAEPAPQLLSAVFAFGAIALTGLILAAFATAGVMSYGPHQPALAVTLSDVTFALLALSGIPTAVCLGSLRQLPVARGDCHRRRAGDLLRMDSRYQRGYVARGWSGEAAERLARAPARLAAGPTGVRPDDQRTATFLRH